MGDYINQRIEFVYNIIPLLDRLRILYHFQTENVQSKTIIIDDKYRYSFVISGIHCHITRCDNSLKYMWERKIDIIYEMCYITRDEIHKNRLLELPKNIYHINNLGEFSLSKYTVNVFKSNYCVYCDKYLNNIKKHLTCKRHDTKKYLFVYDMLNTRVNEDCITNITNYL